jgi:hypothetical protein
MRFAAIALFLSLSAHAAPAAIETDALRSLPTLAGAEVTVHPGPRMAAVQPHAMLKFKFESCARLPMVADVQTPAPGLMLVSVSVAPDAVDCMAVGTLQDYEVQLSSDFRFNTRVIVLNPVKTTVVQ